MIYIIGRKDNARKDDNLSSGTDMGLIDSTTSILQDRQQVSQRTKENLQESIKEMMSMITNSVGEFSKRKNVYELDEIEIKLEISANGDVGLFGTVQAGVGMDGGVTLKFKRGGGK